MAGYYIISSPSQRIMNQETEYAVKKADLRSIAECVVSAQNTVMYGDEFTDKCAEKYSVTSQYICMNSKLSIVDCDSKGGKAPDFNFIITTSYALPQNQYNNMLEILEQYYPDAGTLGIMQNNELLTAGSVTKRAIPAAIIKTGEITDGQLIYIMQYTIPEEPINYETYDETNDILCPAGTLKTYRFGRWQCIGYNYKTSCPGDTIWNSDTMECVADESKKPLCATNQSAVLVDDVWECVDPFEDKTCPTGMTARLNYNELQWECVEDPTIKKIVKKCDLSKIKTVSNIKNSGATIRVASNSCTDCEKLVVNEDTCESYCVPDPTKLSDPKCYNSDVSACSGSSMAIYFGFNPNTNINTIPELNGQAIPIDTKHNQNRKFNCLYCVDSIIDTENSVFPYTAICK
ncbi:MAG: hypothetical protein MJ156_00920 [Alphaproteobacteria bacterium]|nr:hypothetical protein [Alphaproteobacteria bacterium]